MIRRPPRSTRTDTLFPYTTLFRSNRLWLRSEGERTNGVTEDAELQALYGHSIGPWWDVVAGVRQDFKPESPQTWAAFGIQGLALYNFEAEATAFIGEIGRAHV